MFSQIRFQLMIKIFITVFKYYQTIYWIDYDILSALANYFSRPLEPILKEYIENQNFTDSYYVRAGNVIMLYLNCWKRYYRHRHRLLCLEIELIKVDNDVIKKNIS